MSPQSRVPVSSESTTSSGGDYGSSCNACSSSPMSVVEMARAINASFAVHTIRGSESDVDCPHSGASSALGKRGSNFISTTESEPTSQAQPFLSSYGSAFLSGIFADIAEAQTGEDVSPEPQDPSFSSYEPAPKKSRVPNPASKAFVALGSLVNGPEGVMSSSVVSPRPQTSTIKIQLFNDQVRELQNLAFPSLPGLHLPATISTASCTAASVGAVVTPREGESDCDQESFGWFVSTDDEDANSEDSAPTSMFLPHSKPSLAFQAPIAPVPAVEENTDVEVQQALAADTIDDVLGDLF